jgi:deoxycytidylate deaminase
MQCAEKIIQAGVVRVCYTEAYPDPYSIGRLNLGKVKMERFTGVRSSSFERIFDRTRPR